MKARYFYNFALPAMLLLALAMCIELKAASKSWANDETQRSLRLVSGSETPGSKPPRPIEHDEARSLGSVDTLGGQHIDVSKNRKDLGSSQMGSMVAAQMCNGAHRANQTRASSKKVTGTNVLQLHRKSAGDLNDRNLSCLSHMVNMRRKKYLQPVHKSHNSTYFKNENNSFKAETQSQTNVFGPPSSDYNPKCDSDTSFGSNRSDTECVDMNLSNLSVDYDFLISDLDSGFLTDDSSRTLGNQRSRNVSGITSSDTASNIKITAGSLVSNVEIHRPHPRPVSLRGFVQTSIVYSSHPHANIICWLVGHRGESITSGGLIIASLKEIPSVSSSCYTNGTEPCIISMRIPSSYFNETNYHITPMLSYQEASLLLTPVQLFGIPHYKIPIRGMTLQLPLHPIQKSTTFTTQLAAITGEKKLENFDIDVQFNPNIIRMLSVAGDGKFHGTVIINNGTATIVWNRQNGILESSVTGCFSIATITWYAMDDINAHRTHISLLVRRMNDLQNAPIISPGTKGIVMDRWNASQAGLIHFADDSVRGYFLSIRKQEIFNIARLTGSQLIAPIKVIQFWEFQRPIDVSSTTNCTSSDPAVAPVENCSLIFSGTEKGGSESVIISSNTASSSIRVWFPLPDAVISAEDTTLNRISDWIEPPCVKESYQRSRLSAHASFISGNDFIKVDITRWVTFRSSSPEIALISGSTIYGVSQGTVLVSLQELSSKECFISVSSQPVLVTEIESSILTDIHVQLSSTYVNHASDTVSITATGIQHFDAENKAGHPVSHAIFSDGTRMPLSESLGLSLSSNNPSVFVSNSPTIILAKESGCGYFIDVTWSSCGKIIKHGNALVNIRLPQVIRISGSTNTTRIVHPNDISGSLGIPINAPLFVTGIMEDGALIDYSLDPGTIYDDVSNDPNDLIRVIFCRNHEKISSVYVQATGNGIGHADVIIKLSNAPNLNPLSISINVVSFAELSLHSSPYPTFPNSSIILKSTLKRIECTDIYERVQLVLFMLLSDGFSIDITYTPSSQFTVLDDDKDKVVLDGNVVIPTDRSFGSAKVLAAFDFASTYIDIIVLNTTAQVERLEPVFSDTFSGVYGTTNQLIIHATMSDGTILLNANTFLGLLRYESDHPLVISVEKTSGVVQLFNNSLQQVSIRVSTCNQVSSTLKVYANLLPDVGDIDLGGESGPPISPVFLGQTIRIPVILNSGFWSVGSFDLTILYDSNIFDAISYAIGDSWLGGLLEVTLNDPPGEIGIIGVLEPSSNFRGNKLEIADVLFVARKSAISLISGYVSKIYSNNVEGSSIGPPLRTGEHRTFRAGTFFIRSSIESENITLSTEQRSLMGEKIHKLNGTNSTCEPSLILGNTNGDCEFSVMDVQFTLWYFAGLIKDSLSDWQLKHLDADRDGTIQVQDAVFLIRVLANKWRFISIDITPPTKSDSSFSVRLLAKDAFGNNASSQTLIQFIILTTLNNDLQLSQGTVVESTSTMVNCSAINLGNGTYLIQGNVKRKELHIGIVIQEKTFDSLGQSSNDRDVILSHRANSINQESILWDSGFEPENKNFSIVSALFEPMVQNVSVIFSQRTNRAGLQTMFSCDSLFVNTGSLSCEWVSDSQVIIMVGCSGVIKIGDNITLIYDTLMSYDSTQGSQPFTGYAIVSTNSSDVSLSVVLSGPQIIGTCSKLVVDSFLSTSSNNKCQNVEYRWSLTASPLDVSILDHYLSEISSAKSVLELDVDLPPGVNYTVCLELILPSGISNSSSVTIMKLNKAIPEVQIDGPSEKQFYPSQTNTIVAIAGIPPCLNASSLEFQWNQVEGPSIQLDSTAKATRSLVIHPFLMRPFNYYAFKISACVSNSSELCNTAVVRIYSISVGLRPIIAGGSTSVVGTKRNFYIDAGLSYNHDVKEREPQLFSFSWSCFSSATNGSCTDSEDNELEFEDTSKLTIVQSSSVHLPPGNYTFSVSVEHIDKSYPPVYTSKTIIVVDGDPPLVDISPLKQLLPSVSSPLRVSASVWSPTNNRLSYAWTISGGASSFEDFGMSTSSLSSLKLTIPPGKLKEDTKYTLRLTVVDNISNAKGYSEISFTTNILPFGGSFEVPSDGGDQLDLFTVQAFGWTSVPSNMPLSFAFGYAMSYGDSDLIVSGFSSSCVRKIVMPAGGMTGEDAAYTYLEAFVLIQDSAGNSRRLSKKVRVKPLTFADDDRLKLTISSELIERGMMNALNVGDYDGLYQYNSGVMNVLNSMNLNSRVRTCSSNLLSAGEIRYRAFQMLRDSDQRQLFTTEVQIDSIFQQYSRIFVDTCISMEFSVDASQHLNELAHYALSTSVLSNTGAALSSAFEVLYGASKRISSGKRNGTPYDASLIEVIQLYINSTKAISRAGLSLSQCGDEPYTVSGSIIKSSSMVLCSDSDAPIVKVETSDGDVSVQLSELAFKNYDVSIQHVINCEDYPLAPNQDIIGSSVLSVVLENPTSSYQEIPVTGLPMTNANMIVLPRKQTPSLKDSQYAISCQFFDEVAGDWSTSGCVVYLSSISSVTCVCNHLTSFAVILNPVFQPSRSFSDFNTLNEVAHTIAETNPGRRTEHPFTPASKPQKDSGLTATIIGGFIGAIGLAMTIIGVAFLVIKRRQLNRISDGPNGANDARRELERTISSTDSRYMDDMATENGGHDIESARYHIDSEDSDSDEPSAPRVRRTYDHRPEIRVDGSPDMVSTRGDEHGIDLSHPQIVIPTSQITYHGDEFVAGSLGDDERSGTEDGSHGDTERGRNVRPSPGTILGRIMEADEQYFYGNNRASSFHSNNAQNVANEREVHSSSESSSIDLPDDQEGSSRPSFPGLSAEATLDDFGDSSNSSETITSEEGSIPSSFKNSISFLDDSSNSDSPPESLS